MNPELTVEAVEEQMEALASEQLPEIQREDFWTAHMDQILLRGASGGVASARKAANRILTMYPDLRLENGSAAPACARTPRTIRKDPSRV